MAGGLRGVEGFKGESGGWMLDPRFIVIEGGHNLRSAGELRANIDALKPQIKAMGGVMNPLHVRRDGDKAILLDGESRLRAIMELIDEGNDYDRVPVRWYAGAASEIDKTVLQMAANEGRPFQKWELGVGYVRFLNNGLTVPEIAEKMGKSQAFISECMTLADATPELKAEMERGKVTTAKVAQAVKKGSAAVKELAQKVRESEKPIKRGKAVDPLRKAVAAVLAEADEAEDGYTAVEISKKAINALRKSFK